MTEQERKEMEAEGLTETEYWFRRTRKAEKEIRRLEMICDSQEREIDRLNSEEFSDD